MIPAPLTTDEIEELLAQEVWAGRNGETIMQHHLDRNPNLIENDLRYQDARREGCTATRGAMRPAHMGGYPQCDPNERSDEGRAWLLVAVAAALVGLALWGLG